MPAEMPDWVTATPYESTYELMMTDGDSSVEQVELTRDEYIAMKLHLAATRGYTVGDFRASIAALIETGVERYSSKDDPQQFARHLQTARDFYMHCLELVVFQSDELDEYLAKLAE